MKRTLAILFGLFTVSLAFTVQAKTPPIIAAEPGVLVAQIDDSDLRDEESLKQLMKIEYDKDAWSMSVAVGSSFVPGAGWGLVYTKKKLQAAIPFVLSAVGYGLGIAYMAGAFDTQKTQICTHTRDGRVNLAECGYADITRDANNPDMIDNQDADPRSENGMTPYFRTKGDYSTSFANKDFDGFNTGLYVLVGTYIVTTTLGAVWAGSTVAAHNEQLRKDIESTAGRTPTKPKVSAQPILGFDGRRGVLGFALEF